MRQIIYQDKFLVEYEDNTTDLVVGNIEDVKTAIGDKKANVYQQIVNPVDEENDYESLDIDMSDEVKAFLVDYAHERSLTINNAIIEILQTQLEQMSDEQSI